METCITEDMDLATRCELAGTLPAEVLLRSTAYYNWDIYPVETLSIIARRPDCSLLTALSIFYAGQPGDFEHTGTVRPKSMWQRWLSALAQVLRRQSRPPEQQLAAQSTFGLLRYIHDRINAGGYQILPSDIELNCFDEPKDLFLAPRRRSDGRPVIWRLDPVIVRPALASPEQKAARHRDLVALAARRHNAELLSSNPLVRELASSFEEAYPDAPAIQEAKRLRGEKPQKTIH